MMERIYFNPSNRGSFGGVQRLISAAKNENKDDVKKWLSYQDSYTLHRKTVRKFPRRRILVGGIDHQWMTDLLDVTTLSKINDGYKFVLVCIDVLSKYAWAIPIHNKTGKSVVDAFKTILESSNRKPISLQSDKGTEYYNSTFKTFLKENRINHFSTENDDIKASMAERFIRTLKSRMWRLFTYKRKKRYVEDLQHIVHSYNSTIHSTIKMAPNSVNKDNEFRLLDMMHNSPVHKTRKRFNIGDTIRISMTRQPFKKGYDKQWTEEVFEIAQHVRTSPITYRLRDLQGDPLKGTFYAQELQRVRINTDTIYSIDTIVKTRRKKGKIQYFVKWVGFPEKFNSWINKENVTV